MKVQRYIEIEIDIDTETTIEIECETDFEIKAQRDPNVIPAASMACTLRSVAFPF